MHRLGPSARRVGSVRAMLSMTGSVEYDWPKSLRKRLFSGSLRNRLFLGSLRNRSSDNDSGCESTSAMQAKMGQVRNKCMMRRSAKGNRYLEGMKGKLTRVESNIKSKNRTTNVNSSADLIFACVTCFVMKKDDELTCIETDIVNLMCVQVHLLRFCHHSK